MLRQILSMRFRIYLATSFVAIGQLRKMQVAFPLNHFQTRLHRKLLTQALPLLGRSGN
jgi:hypothetical protein